MWPGVAVVTLPPPPKEPKGREFESRKKILGLRPRVSGPNLGLVFAILCLYFIHVLPTRMSSFLMNIARPFTLSVCA